MEKAIRERLTGAVILFAALAILVPEMLSGPGDGVPGEQADALADTGPPLTTYELSLDPDAPAAPRQAAPADASRTLSDAVALPAAPVPPAAPPPETEPSEAAPPPVAQRTEPAAPAPSSAPAPAARNAAPAPTPAATARTTAPAPTPPAGRPAAPAAPAAAAPAAASGQWWVQLGSFSSEQNARGLASRLRTKGFSIEVSKVRSGNRDLFRVRAGPERTRDAATALRARLAAAGEQGTLVAP